MFTVSVKLVVRICTTCVFLVYAHDTPPRVQHFSAFHFGNVVQKSTIKQKSIVLEEDTLVRSIQKSIVVLEEDKLKFNVFVDLGRSYFRDDIKLVVHAVKW